MTPQILFCTHRRTASEEESLGAASGGHHLPWWWPAPCGQWGRRWSFLPCLSPSPCPDTGTGTVYCAGPGIPPLSPVSVVERSGKQKLLVILILELSVYAILSLSAFLIYIYSIYQTGNSKCHVTDKAPHTHAHIHPLSSVTLITKACIIFYFLL